MYENLDWPIANIIVSARARARRSPDADSGTRDEPIVRSVELKQYFGNTLYNCHGDHSGRGEKSASDPRLFAWLGARFLILRDRARSRCANSVIRETYRESRVLFRQTGHEDPSGIYAHTVHYVTTSELGRARVRGRSARSLARASAFLRKRTECDGRALTMLVDMPFY